tara:strand:- start:117 stop:629 length:513 start_codon:yes stop_codon:yes gene_type:complete
MYKNELQPVLIQVAVAAAMIFFGTTVLTSYIMMGIVVVFALLLLKDAYEMYKAEYVIGKKGLEYLVGDKIKWEMPWITVDMITRTKKNPRWVVVSDGTDFKMLKHTITNFDAFINQVVLHSAQNKELKMHETINQYLPEALDLDDMGRIKKKSRQKLLGSSDQVEEDATL